MKGEMGPVTASSLGVHGCSYADGNDPEVKLGYGRQEDLTGPRSLGW